MTFSSSATISGELFMCESPSKEKLRPIVQANRGEKRRRLSEDSGGLRGERGDPRENIKIFKVKGGAEKGNLGCRGGRNGKGKVK